MQRRLMEQRRVAIVALFFLLTGCGSVQSMLSEDLGRSLSAGVARQTDVALVKEGLPAYVLMIDGLIAEHPDNGDLYIAAAKLYGVYAGLVHDDGERAARLTDKAFDYGKQALCLTAQQWCGVENRSFDSYRLAIADAGKTDVVALHALALAWVNWIDAHKSDWNAIADLPKVTLTMRRIIELDERYDGGSAYLYLAVLESLLPPALGGKPEIARAHFEKVIELTNGQNLMAKVLFAERYARGVYNRELHDSLLKDVLAQDAVGQDMALSNTIARLRAGNLMKSADDYF